MDERLAGRSTLVTLIAATIAGAALGLASSKLLFLQGFTLLPWGAVALVVGYASPSIALSVVDGAAYGFALGFVFMIGGYAGTDPIVSKLPFFAGLGIASALVAMILSAAGYLLRTRLPSTGSKT